MMKDRRFGSEKWERDSREIKKLDLDTMLQQDFCQCRGRPWEQDEAPVTFHSNQQGKIWFLLMERKEKKRKRPENSNAKPLSDLRRNSIDCPFVSSPKQRPCSCHKDRSGSLGLLPTLLSTDEIAAN